MSFLELPQRKHRLQRSYYGVALNEIIPKEFPESFHLPEGHAPKDFVASHCSPGTYEDNGQKVKFAKGTTTLAFKYQGGVIVAVDSRASQGTYISSQTVQKVIPITRRILGTMAGGAADCLFWQRNLGTKVRLHELRNKSRISVAAASKLLTNTMNYYKGSGLSMGTMVTGLDETDKDGVGAALYYIDNDATRLEATKSQPYFCVGSGSTYAYGVMDTEYKWNLKEKDAIELGRKAIMHATHRDGASGGMNNVYVIGKGAEKWEKLIPIDVNDMLDDYLAKRRDGMELS